MEAGKGDSVNPGNNILRLMMFRRMILLICVILLIGGGSHLSKVTNLMGVQGLQVPDLLPFLVGMEQVKDTFDQLRMYPSFQQMYIEALWTADVLMPLGMAGALTLGILIYPMHRTRWYPLTLLPTAAFLSDLAENLLATMVLEEGSHNILLLGWMTCHTSKQAFLFVSVVAMALSIVMRIEKHIHNQSTQEL